MEGLLLAPVDKAAVYLGKAAAVAGQLIALEAVVIVLVSALFSLSLTDDAGLLAAAFALGTIGLSGIGALFGALDASARAREAVFPLLILPFATPVLVAGVKATAFAMAGRGGDAGQWLR